MERFDSKDINLVLIVAHKLKLYPKKSRISTANVHVRYQFPG